MTVENKKVPAYTKKSLRDRWSHDLRHNWWLWVMFLPVVVYYAIFSYAPMYGILMSVGFEKVYLLQNDLNFAASDIISTYTYRVGMINSDFGYSTAVGLFNTVINLIILIFANTLARKATGEGLW